LKFSHPHISGKFLNFETDQIHIYDCDCTYCSYILEYVYKKIKRNLNQACDQPVVLEGWRGGKIKILQEKYQNVAKLSALAHFFKCLIKILNL